MQDRHSVARMLGLMGLAIGLIMSPTALAVAAGDVNQVGCPTQTEASPGFRNYLPDCRAYEMVTPPFKDGEPPLTENAAMAANGSSLSFTSLGAFAAPGDDVTVQGGEYVTSREAAGWSSLPVNPPADKFLGGSPEKGSSTHETLDYSKDLEHTLFLQAPIADKPIDARFYAYDIPTKSFTEVGPLLSPETVAAWTPRDAEASQVFNTEYSGGRQGTCPTYSSTCFLPK
jgi:hypothetical protein